MSATMDNDQLNDVLDDACAAQPAASATGDGIRQELEALTPGDGARLDREGQPFDPSRHASPPTLTARGTWRKLRGAATALAAPEDPASQCDEAAQQTCDFVFGTGAAVLAQFLPLPAGQQWEPSEQERSSIEAALSRFYVAHPEWMFDLPPGLALVVAVGAYALPRVLSLPVAQRSLSRWVRGSATEAAQQPDPGAAVLGEFEARNAA